MSKLKRHHYIPKSYLKNFAVDKDGKFFVEARLLSEDAVRPKLISTVDICVEKDLYTIPNVEGDDKYAIERYYASEIDSVFPEIYRLLTDKTISELTEDQRRKVILTTMSLFFRTPKFLKQQSKHIERLAHYAARHHSDENGFVTFKHDIYNLDFHVSQLNEIIEDLKIKNRITFLNDHLKDLHEFVEYKLQAGMMVVSITGEADLITSDNPVIIRSHVNDKFSLFDPTNIIHVPIDNKHYLMIAPNSEDALPDQVFRSGRKDIMFVLTSNLQVEKNAESWVFGKPGSVEAHIEDQVKYNELSQENLQRVADIKQKSKNEVKLTEMMEQHGATDPKVISYIQELLEDPLHQDDSDIREVYDQLKKMGWIS